MAGEACIGRGKQDCDAARASQGVDRRHGGKAVRRTRLPRDVDPGHQRRDGTAARRPLPLHRQQEGPALPDPRAVHRTAPRRGTSDRGPQRARPRNATRTRTRTHAHRPQLPRPGHRLPPRMENDQRRRHLGRRPRLPPRLRRHLRTRHQTRRQRRNTQDRRHPTRHARLPRHDQLQLPMVRPQPAASTPTPSPTTSPTSSSTASPPATSVGEQILTADGSGDRAPEHARQARRSRRRLATDDYVGTSTYTTASSTEVLKTSTGGGTCACAGRGPSRDL